MTPTLTFKISKPWHVFTIKTGTNISTLDASRITQKYWTWPKIITKDNHASLFVLSINDEVKVYKHDTKVQCRKTFLLRHWIPNK
jgi:hypothetical protein